MVQKLNDTQKELINKNHNIIYSAIHSLRLSCDDYYDIGALALCSAAQSYNSDNPFKAGFRTYAYKIIRNSLINNLKADKERLYCSDLQILEDNKDSEDGYSGGITIASTEDIEMNYIIKDTVFRLVNDQPCGNKKEVTKYLLGGKCAKEIADELKISLRYVYQARKEICDMYLQKYA